MLKLAFVLMVVLGGVTAGLQATMNAELGRRIGPIESALLTFAGGAVVLALLTVFFGSGQLHRIGEVPWWQLTGGLMGAFIMAGLILGVTRLGAATAILASILGQIALGVVVDHYGLFGVARTPLGPARALAVGLMVVALLIVVRTQAPSAGP